MKRNLEDLEKLDELLKKGIITEDEFNKEKDKILNSPKNQFSDNLFGLNENTYCFLIHISVLLGFIHVILGLITPIILWTLNREKYQSVNLHGKNVLNWILSFVTYLLICFIIVFPLNSLMHSSLNFSYNFSSPISLFSGFLPITILMILNIIFIVIGGLKASSGKLWKYPLSIKFLKDYKSNCQKYKH